MNSNQTSVGLSEGVNFLRECVSTRRVLRTVHHLACSGGSIISKCLMSLPNVYLLSELHSSTTLHVYNPPAYTPRDIATQSLHGNIPGIEEVNRACFYSQLSKTVDHCESIGGYLVVRDHSHSDFCVGETFCDKSTLLLETTNDYENKKVVTVRNPFDAYYSLQRNGWVHFKPCDIDEYCKRALQFLSQFDSSEIFKYEDFVNDPATIISSIAMKLDIPYSKGFLEYQRYKNISGDSGRSSGVIEPRPKNCYSDEYIKEINRSSYGIEFCEKYDYTAPIKG